MPTTIARTVTLYKFDELSDHAKEVARQWWRDAQDSSDTEHVYDDASAMGELIGIVIDSKPYKTMGGGNGASPAIYYSGFSSQGDGASFDGRYSYVKGAAKAIRENAPQDKTLHAIADKLQSVQRKHFYRLTARCKQSGHYMHSDCMDVQVTDSEYRDIGDAETEVRDTLRLFADWIYDQLEGDYEYRMSDESIAEAMESNAYTFDVNGKRAD